MIDKSTLYVTPEQGPRPNGKPDECFYCQQKMGEKHKNDCVIPQKTIIIKMEIQYAVSVPLNYGDGFVGLQRNTSSWCADNAMDELAKLQKQAGCLCGLAKFSYVRDATSHDELVWAEDE